MIETQPPHLKVLHVTRNINPIGGCEIYIRNLIRELSNRSMEIGLCVAIEPEKNAAESFVTVRTIPSLTALRHAVARDSVRDFKMFLDDFHPDVIHIHDLNNPYVIERCARLYPTVKTTSNADVYCGGIDKYLYASHKACNFRLGFGCLLIAYFERCMSRHPSRMIEIISIKKKALKAAKSIECVTTPSQSTKDILIQNGMPSDNIEVLPIFASFPNLKKISPYPKMARKILFIGRLQPYKGVSYLLRALKKLSGLWNAIIIGDGDQKVNLVRLCQELAIVSQVQFLGNLPHENVAKFIDQSSLLVVPSIYPDCFPTVGLEAMAHGRPVVGFQIGGIPEWLEDGKTGFLVQPQDVSGLADRVSFLLDNPVQAEAMGIMGRRRFEEKFSANAHLRKLLPIYERAIASFESKRTSAR